MYKLSNYEIEALKIYHQINIAIFENGHFLIKSQSLLENIIKQACLTKCKKSISSLNEGLKEYLDKQKEFISSVNTKGYVEWDSEYTKFRNAVLFINGMANLFKHPPNITPSDLETDLARNYIKDCISWYAKYIIVGPLSNITAPDNQIKKTLSEILPIQKQAQKSASEKTESEIIRPDQNKQAITNDGVDSFEKKRLSQQTKNEETIIIPNIEITKANFSQIKSEDYLELGKKTVDINEYFKKNPEKIKEKEIEKKEREKVEFEEETKKLKELIKPITGDIITDFFMIDDLKNLVQIKNNKIIIDKSTGEIIFDFSNHTVSEKHVIKFKRTVKYKEIIDKHLKGRYDESAMKIRFSSINIYGGDSWNSYVKFEIGKEEFKARFYTPYPKNYVFQKMYLFYCYLLAYMSGLDIYKIVNIEDLRRAKWNDTPSIDLKYLNEPDSEKENLIMAKKKLSDDLWDKWGELNLANKELGKLSFWDFEGIKKMKSKILILSKEYVTIGNNLNDTAIRASRTSREL